MSASIMQTSMTSESSSSRSTSWTPRSARWRTHRGPDGPAELHGQHERRRGRPRRQPRHEHFQPNTPVPLHGDIIRRGCDSHPDSPSSRIRRSGGSSSSRSDGAPTPGGRGGSWPRAAKRRVIWAMAVARRGGARRWTPGRGGWWARPPRRPPTRPRRWPRRRGVQLEHARGSASGRSSGNGGRPGRPPGSSTPGVEQGGPSRAVGRAGRSPGRRRRHGGGGAGGEEPSRSPVTSR